MIILALLGAGSGLGCWLMVRALWPRPVPLDAVVARLDRPGLAVTAPASATTLADRAGRRALALLGLSRRPDEGRDRLLRICGRTPERHAFAKLAGCGFGAAGAALLGTALVAAGPAVPPLALLVVVAGAGAAGFVLPDLRLAEATERRRRAFRHTLSAYLDLVNLVLAAGGGIESALYGAAESGEGWAFAALRQSLDRSRLTNRSPWEGFARLGEEMGVAELGELAASISLAGSQGARIRSSLAAKADTLRGHQVAEAESSAEASTERMTVPVVVLLFGFLAFVAYPALVGITAVSTHHLS